MLAELHTPISAANSSFIVIFFLKKEMTAIDYGLGIAIIYMTALVSTLGMWPIGKYTKDRKKSPIDPPDIVFSIVWPILYTLEGIALGGLMSDPNYILIAMFIIQSLISASWTWIFFKWDEKLIALDVLIVTVVCSILLMIFMWKEYYILQMWLFSPYVAWCTFACVLNYMNLN